jgi:hypothetical protein
MTPKWLRMTRAEHARTFHSGATRLGAGFWLDTAGDLHVSVPELLDLVALPDTPTNRADARRIITEVLQRQLPGAPLVLVLDDDE